MCIISRNVGVDATQIRRCIARFRYALIRRGQFLRGGNVRYVRCVTCNRFVTNYT